jgi:hypothetical protein
MDSMTRLPCGHTAELRDLNDPAEGEYLDSCFVCGWKTTERHRRDLEAQKRLTADFRRRLSEAEEANERLVYLSSEALDLAARAINGLKVIAEKVEAIEREQKPEG